VTSGNFRPRQAARRFTAKAISHRIEKELVEASRAEFLFLVAMKCRNHRHRVIVAVDPARYARPI